MLSSHLQRWKEKAKSVYYVLVLLNSAETVREVLRWDRADDIILQK